MEAISNEIIFINLTPIFDKDLKEIQSNNKKSDILNFYLWYDLYLKPNDYKKAKLFFIDENIGSLIRLPFFIQLDSFFIENNICIDYQSMLINDLNDIYINIFNKNDFYIHIKNGTKIAKSFLLNYKDKLNFDNAPKIININNNINSQNNVRTNNKAQLFLNKKRISQINDVKLIGKNDSENINKFGKDNIKKINKKINCLLLYINKGKKGNLKKRLKTSIILNYLEGSSLYLFRLLIIIDAILKYLKMN